MLKHLTLFCCVFGYAHMILPAATQEGLQLSRDCYGSYGYVTPPATCTCRKTNSNAPGLVEWVLPDGTLADQQSDTIRSTATVNIVSPYEYARSVTYICRWLVQEDTAAAELTYTANLTYGPEDARLYSLEPDVVYLCPSDAAKDVTLYCDVPASTVKPSPVFTVTANGRRYGAYDKYGGVFDEDENVWRQVIYLSVTSAGSYDVACYVRNMYGPSRWINLRYSFSVSDNPPAGEC